MTATVQDALDLGDLTYPEPSPTLAESFAEFDRANPNVRAALVRLLEADLDAGFTYTSMKFLYELLRRDGVRTTGRPYRLNNSWTAFYAKSIASERPDLAPLLRLRERAA